MALRHFRMVQEIAASVGDGYNLADILNSILAEGRIEDHQVRPIVNMLLVDKYGYAAKSINLRDAIKNVERLGKIIKTWTNIQAVLVYNSSNGLVLLNPEEPASWENALPLLQGTHVVCYACALENNNYELAGKAASDVMQILCGGQVKSNAKYRASRDIKQFVTKTDAVPAAQADASPDAAKTEKPHAEAPGALPSASQSNKLTAKIGVNVTNELFHNGNVEAWKRIIQSYRAKYPQLDVLVWYDGERINDLNSLFKWGKVKHGTPIMFSVAGDDPVSLSKLRKYLFEGASSRFEAFLHGSPGSVLALF